MRRSRFSTPLILLSTTCALFTPTKATASCSGWPVVCTNNWSVAPSTSVPAYQPPPAYVPPNLPPLRSPPPVYYNNNGGGGGAETQAPQQSDSTIRTAVALNQQAVALIPGYNALLAGPSCKNLDALKSIAFRMLNLYRRADQLFRWQNKVVHANFLYELGIVEDLAGNCGSDIRAEKNAVKYMQLSLEVVPNAVTVQRIRIMKQIVARIENDGRSKSQTTCPKCEPTCLECEKELRDHLTTAIGMDVDDNKIRTTVIAALNIWRDCAGRTSARECVAPAIYTSVKMGCATNPDLEIKSCVGHIVRFSN
jgi:hypothetical protein